MWPAASAVSVSEIPVPSQSSSGLPEMFTNAATAMLFASRPGSTASARRPPPRIVASASRTSPMLVKRR